MFYSNSNPQSGSTTVIQSECEPWRDEQRGYDGYQTTQHPNVFETETASQPQDVETHN